MRCYVHGRSYFLYIWGLRVGKGSQTFMFLNMIRASTQVIGAGGGVMDLAGGFRVHDEK